MTTDTAIISFACTGCGRAFSVPAGYAGRRASCRKCGASVVVPAMDANENSISPRIDVPPIDVPPRSLDADVPPPPRVPVRIRRLNADAEQMKKIFGANGPIRIREAIGNPPDLYRIEYHVRSLQRGWFGRPKARMTHLVEIQLTSEYPRLSPKCRMLTPIFHPNIDPTTICVGDHWTAGERLVDLVVRIGEMLAYQAYNIRSPLDAHAAMWADLNPGKLPTDPRTIRPAELD